MSDANVGSPILYVRDCTEFRPASSEEMVAAARSALSRRFRRGCSLTTPHLIRDYLRTTFSAAEHEVFSLILVDSRHRLIDCVELFRGTIDGAAIYTREVVKEVLKHNAAGVVFAHNHPSGIAEPSRADELITIRLRDALATIDVRVIDHLVIGGSDIVSFAERGLV